MNIKEFNEEKQRIIKFIHTGIKQGELIMREHGDTLMRDLKELHLPTAPTCNTCAHKINVFRLTEGGSKILSNYFCEKVSCLSKDDFGDEDRRSLPLSGFGCNQHSDYDLHS